MLISSQAAVLSVIYQKKKRLTLKNLRAVTEYVVHNENRDHGVLRTDNISLQAIDGCVRAFGRIFSLNRGELRAAS